MYFDKDRTKIGVSGIENEPFIIHSKCPLVHAFWIKWANWQPLAVMRWGEGGGPTGSAGLKRQLPRQV